MLTYFLTGKQWIKSTKRITTANRWRNYSDGISIFYLSFDVCKTLNMWKRKSKSNKIQYKDKHHVRVIPNLLCDSSVFRFPHSLRMIYSYQSPPWWASSDSVTPSDKYIKISGRADQSRWLHHYIQVRD